MYRMDCQSLRKEAGTLMRLLLSREERWVFKLKGIGMQRVELKIKSTELGMDWIQYVIEK